MSLTDNGFETRLRNVQRTRSRMVNGYVSKVGSDGLIVFRPKRRQAHFPWRGLALLIFGVFLFKGLILAQLGDVAYENRVQSLQQGSVLEQVCAGMMFVDPLTQAIALKAKPLFW